MRKLTYFVGTTIDGFIAGPDGSVDFFPMEGPHVDWMIARYPETIPGHFRGQVGITAENAVFDTLVMGRATYEPALKVGITSPYPHLRQYVVSRTLAESPDPAVEIVSGDPLAKVRELKQEDGKGIWLCGGGQLAGALRPEIDELVIKLYPIVAGAGTPLFAGEFEPGFFELTESETFENGAAALTYVKTSAPA
jgi:dihydrofolate reductase